MFSKLFTDLSTEQQETLAGGACEQPIRILPVVPSRPGDFINPKPNGCIPFIPRLWDCNYFPL